MYNAICNGYNKNIVENISFLFYDREYIILIDDCYGNTFSYAQKSTPKKKKSISISVFMVSSRYRIVMY